jgi:hypothetical protein
LIARSEGQRAKCWCLLNVEIITREIVQSHQCTTMMLEIFLSICLYVRMSSLFC